MKSTSKARLEAFSDGVIAILITIMVIELHVPDALAERIDPKSLSTFLPTVAAYTLSFLVVGIMWVNHHHLLGTLQKVTRPILWLNVLLLFTMSFVPLSTAFFGEHPASSIAAATYGGVLFACASAFTLLQRSITSLQPDGRHGRLATKYVAGLSLYGAAAVLGLVSPRITWVIIGLNALLFFLPEALTGHRSAETVEQ